MQNDSSTTGRGITVNGAVSTLKRQQRPKTASSRQERGSCSSTASCPVFSGCQADLDEEPPPRCPSSLSSPALHRPGSTSSLKDSAPSLQGSLSSIKGSVTSLKSFPTSSALGSSSFSLRSSSPSLRSSSSSQRSGSSSEDDSWDTNSWSSGATCLLRSSIKQHSEEVFRVRVGSVSRPEGTSDSETGYQNSDSCQGSVVGSESQEGAEQTETVRSDSVTSSASTASTDLEQKIEEKLKFSQFLDEVTCRVLDPKCLEAFGAPIRQTVTSPLQYLNLTPVCSPWFASSRDCDSMDSNAPVSVYKWAKCMPSCKILDGSETLRRIREESLFSETLGRSYLETDIDRVRREDDVSFTHLRDVEKRTLQPRCTSPGLKRSEGAPRPPYRSTSLPRPAVSAVKGSNGDAYGSGSEQDLRRHLSCTTHKLQLLESEFESTRQFLEAELQQAQDEFDKFMEKLRRIQSSYAALQRINQDMEEKIQRMTQRYEEEKRSLNGEIFTLNNRLMEAKITIQKLREDNDLYRRDCNLAAQLLQCGKSPYRAHKLSELPADLQRRVNSHMEKQDSGWTIALGQSYSDTIPTAVIGRVLEKPEPGRSCPVTCSPSPQAPDFPPGTEKVQRRVAHKSSDLHCSDTALYCPADERRHDRWPERRQSADQSILIQECTNIKPENESFPAGSSPHRDPPPGYVLRTLPASGCYSGFSAASDQKARVLSDSQQALLADWHDGNYERKNPSSYGKKRSGFPKSSSFQHVNQASQNGSSTAHSPSASAYSTPGAHGERRRDVHTPGDTVGSWRQMSLEEMNSFSFCSPGSISPLSFSEQNFTVSPTKMKLSPLYSSFQDGDNGFHMDTLDQRFPASVGSSPALNTRIGLNLLKPEKGQMFHSKDAGRGSSGSFFISGNAKESERMTEDGLQRDHQSPSSSVESLNHGLDVQRYKKDLHSPRAQRNTSQFQTLRNTRLSRKDSLTKAQLYGTLLN